MLLSVVGYGVAFLVLFFFARKCRIPFFWIGIPMISMGVCHGLLVPLAGMPLAGYGAFLVPLFGTGFCTVGWIALLFFRDPPRRPPQTQGVVVSPADGVVRFIRRVAAGEMPVIDKGGHPIVLRELFHPDNPIPSGILIGIEMRLIDVHVNRAPISGRVVYRAEIAGRFLSLKSPEARAENHRVYTAIVGKEGRVGVIQVASRRVRRIVNRLRVGEIVEIGDRIGMIRFGSQVDLLIDPEGAWDLLVSENARVKAGETVIARYVSR